MKRVPLAVSAAIASIAVVPWLVWWSHLPAQVATHWDVGGHADGHMGRVGALAVLGGVSVALAVGAAVRPAAIASPILAFVAAVIAWASLATAVSNRDESSWPHSRLALAWVALGIAMGLGAAWLYARAVKGEPRKPIAPGQPAIALSDAERVAWIGSTSSNLFRAIALALVALGVIALVVMPQPTGVIVILSALLVADFTSARVLVNREGFSMTGALGWPRVMIEVDRIESAEMIDVHPMEWGGWGYRGSLTFMRRAAWITHAGPGVHLVLKDGREFVATVDEAEEAAAVVNGLLMTR